MGLPLRAQGRALLFLSTLTLVLAAPSAAHAARTGSLLFGNSSPITCAENTSCILSQGDVDGDPSNNVVSEDGTITDFTFRHVDGDVAFVVLRQTGSGFSVVDRTNYVTGSGDDEEESYNVTGVSARAGDFIGLALAPGASVGARDATGDTGTNVLEFTDANPPALVADDQAAELFLQATYEPNDTSPPPDDSGFDFGGDTSSAEPDPLAALKAGARPKVTISGKAVRASKKYSIRITVRNPNGYGVRGKLSLKSKGLKVGSKSFAVAPESTASVRVKLSRKARSRLARRRTLKATVSASYKGPIGKAGSSKKRVTLKAPKRPKPRRRRPSGGGGGGGGGGLFRPPLCVPHIEYDANGWAHAVPC